MIVCDRCREKCDLGEMYHLTLSKQIATPKPDDAVVLFRGHLCRNCKAYFQDQIQLSVKETMKTYVREVQTETCMAYLELLDAAKDVIETFEAGGMPGGPITRLSKAVAKAKE